MYSPGGANAGLVLTVLLVAVFQVAVNAMRRWRSQQARQELAHDRVMSYQCNNARPFLV